MPHRLLVASIIRSTVTVVLLFAAYYALPATGSNEGPDWAWLLLVLAGFGVVVAVQLPAIVKSKHPGARAIESLALVIPLFLLVFSRVYLSQSLADPAVFSEPLDHNTALYFTVTVFATVGFGDITPVSTPLRMIVSVQMLLNLVVLGAVIKLIASTAQRAMKSRGGAPPLLAPPREDDGKERA